MATASGIFMALTKFAPALLRLAKGDKAAAVASKALAVAQAITGETAPNAIVAAIEKDPALALQFQQQMNHVLLAELDAENKQLETINATMRVESASKDRFVSRWRPTFGYIVSITWMMQMTAISYVIVAHPEQAAAAIGALAGLSVMWSVALSVLGVQVIKRSEDKQVAAGQIVGPGIIGAIASRIAGKK